MRPGRAILAAVAGLVLIAALLIAFKLYDDNHQIPLTIRNTSKTPVVVIRGRSGGIALDRKLGEQWGAQPGGQVSITRARKEHIIVITDDRAGVHHYVLELRGGTRQVDIVDNPDGTLGFDEH
jgi:hypothetical protein